MKRQHDVDLAAGRGSVCTSRLYSGRSRTPSRRPARSAAVNRAGTWGSGRLNEVLRSATLQRAFEYLATELSRLLDRLHFLNPTQSSTHMSLRSIRFTFTVVAVIVICSAAWWAAQLRAQADPPDPNRQQFGIVGLVRGQTARLNIVYLPPVDPDLPPGPCRVRLMFLNSQGDVITESDVSLMPGHGGYVDAVNDRRSLGSPRPGAADPPDPGRQQLRGAWFHPPDPGLPPIDPDRPSCSSDHFIANIEIFGRDGATSVLYPGTFVPPVDPDMPAPK